MAPTCNNCNDLHSFQNRKHSLRTSSDDNNNNSSCLQKKPRHTPASRKEATRRERIRVQEIRLAYRSLQTVLNIPTHGRPRYLYILQTAIAYIKFLESRLGLSSPEERNINSDVDNKRVLCSSNNNSISSSSSSDGEISCVSATTCEQTETDVMFVESQFDDDVSPISSSSPSITSSLDLSSNQNVFNTDETAQIPSPVDDLQFFKTLLFSSSSSIGQQDDNNNIIMEEIGNELNNKHVYCDL